MDLCGKMVDVEFHDGTKTSGILGYTEEFSEKYNYRKPHMFTVNNYDFKVSHIKKIKGMGN